MLEQKLATLQRLLATTQEASESSWQVGNTTFHSSQVKEQVQLWSCFLAGQRLVFLVTYKYSVSHKSQIWAQQNEAQHFHWLFNNRAYIELWTWIHLEFATSYLTAHI